jgi:glutamyl-tRNA synthetase/glutamyl-Q tRNA(Asp) synthetase
MTAGRSSPRPDLARIPPGATTRFAPAPTGPLHLGHVADALYVWGIARATGGRVILRIEDHDRQRCRPAYESALLEDLEWLGFLPDAPHLEELRRGRSPYRQSDSSAAYAEAEAQLRADGLVYACDCTRSRAAAWAADHDRPWTGEGCPGACRDRGLDDGPGRVLRVGLGGGTERFDDLLAGPVEDEPARDGDLPIRDRHGNRTYGFAVVVDDARHGVDLVIRGRDLLHATGRQIRLGRLLGRTTPPAFLHHPLVHKPGGAKLSKADGDTGIRDLRAAGWTVERVLGEAAAAVGLVPPGVTLRPAAVAGLFTG